MAVPLANQTVKRKAEDVLRSLYPICGDYVGGQCLEEYASGKGFVFYEDYKDCQSSWFLLPGFNLLPDWLLGGEPIADKRNRLISERYAA